MQPMLFEVLVSLVFSIGGSEAGETQDENIIPADTEGFVISGL
jgi:hypothetical protein